MLIFTRDAVLSKSFVVAIRKISLMGTKFYKFGKNIIVHVKLHLIYRTDPNPHSYESILVRVGISPSFRYQPFDTPFSNLLYII